MPVPSPHFLSLLHRAMAAQYGIALRIVESDAETIKEKLGLCRRLARDPELFNLQFMIPPGRANEIWIVKRRRGEDLEEGSRSPEPTGTILPLRIEGS